MLTSILSFFSTNTSGLDNPKIITPAKIDKVIVTDVNFKSGDLSKNKTSGKEKTIIASVVKNSSPKTETFCKMVLI